MGTVPLPSLGSPVTGGASVSSLSVTYSAPAATVAVLVISTYSTISTITVSSVSGGGLSWAKYAGVTLSSPNHYDLEIWWAPVSVAVTSATVTATLSGSAADADMMTTYMSECANINSPWDTNASLPATLASTVSSAPVVFSTTQNSCTNFIAINAHVSSVPTFYSLLNASNHGNNVAAAIYGGTGSPQTGVSISTSTLTPELYIATAFVGLNYPTLLAFSNILNNQVTVSWPASYGAPISYNLKYWPASNPSAYVIIPNITGLTTVVTNLVPNVTYDFQISANFASGTSAVSPAYVVTTLNVFPHYRFLSCQNGWTVASVFNRLYGLDHLIGMNVVGLLDGVLVSMTVTSDGSVTFPFAASNVKVGLPFTPQVQTPYLDAGNPTIQGRRKNITAVTVRIEESAGVYVGTNQPDGGAQVPQALAPAWSQMAPVGPTQPTTYQTAAGQTVTKLFTGDIRIPVTADWATPGQVAIQGTPGLPLNVLAVIPEILEGDTADSGYSREPPNRGDPGVAQGRPGAWMLKR